MGKVKELQIAFLEHRDVHVEAVRWARVGPGRF